MSELDRMLSGWAERQALPESRVRAIWEIPRGECSSGWWKTHFRRVSDVLKRSADPRAFPDVNVIGLQAMVSRLVPEGTDGATRVFLQRIAAQQAVREALAVIAQEFGSDTVLFARADAPREPAPALTWPEHARARVDFALAQMDPALREALGR